MKKKMAIALLSSLLAIGGGFSVFAGASTTNEAVVAEETTTETVDHNVAVAGEHIYVQLNSSYWGTTAACDVYLHAWNTANGTGTTYPGIKIGTTGTTAGNHLLVYTVTEDDVANLAEFNGFQLTRWAAGQTSFTDTNRWNTWSYYSGTNYYSDPAGANYFTNTAWDSFNVGWDTEKTIYVNGPSNYTGWGTSTYAHAWDEGVLGTIFPGFQVDAVNTTGATNFNSKGAIYRVRVPSTTDSVIINNGTSSSSGGIETETLTVVDGANYTIDSGSLSPTGDTLMGTGAKFVYEADKAIRAVEAGTGISAGSICGLSSDIASDLYTQYQEITNEGVKGVVDSSTLYTYDPNGGSESVNVTYGAIATQLSLLANGNNSSPLARVGEAGTDTYVAVIAMTAFAGVSTLAYLFLKRKRERA